MKYLILMILGLVMTSCAYNGRYFGPDHIGVNPSVSWEIERGRRTKVNPEVELNLDWHI